MNHASNPKPLGSHERLLPRAETAARQLIHSWITYGPKQLNHFDPEKFPTGPLQDVAGGVLQGMIHEGVKDLPGLVAHFMDAPEGARVELLECAQDFSPLPSDCGPLIYKLNEYDRALQFEKLSHRLRNAIDQGDSTAEIIRQLAELEAGGDTTPKNADDRFKELSGKSRVTMDQYSMMEPHEARSLLPRELWQGIIREGTLAILGGESKAKKSWFSLSLAMAAVAGTEFLGMAISTPMDAPRRVRVLDFELLEGNVMSRFLAMSEKFEDGTGHRAIWSQVEIYHHRELMSEAADWIGYAGWHCEQLNRGDLLIVDCLQALDVGENNDPGVIRRALGRLQAAATRSGVCILIVDHFNKSSEARGKNRLSGSMAKSATPDSIILLESDGEFIKLSFELRMDPPRGSITLAFDSPSEGFRVVTSEEREERRDSTAETKREEKLNLMFPDRGRRYSKIEIAANIGKSLDTATNWIKDLSEFINTDVQGGKNPNLYSLK